MGNCQGVWGGGWLAMYMVFSHLRCHLNKDRKRGPRSYVEGTQRPRGLKRPGAFQKQRALCGCRQWGGKQSWRRRPRAPGAPWWGRVPGTGSSEQKTDVLPKGASGWHADDRHGVGPGGSRQTREMG